MTNKQENVGPARSESNINNVTLFAVAIFVVISFVSFTFFYPLLIAVALLMLAYDKFPNRVTQVVGSIGVMSILAMGFGFNNQVEKPLAEISLKDTYRASPRIMYPLTFMYFVGQKMGADKLGADEFKINKTKYTALRSAWVSKYSGKTINDDLSFQEEKVLQGKYYLKEFSKNFGTKLYAPFFYVGYYVGHYVSGGFQWLTSSKAKDELFARNLEMQDGVFELFNEITYSVESDGTKLTQEEKDRLLTEIGELVKSI